MVHSFTMNGTYIVLDANSGAVSLIDEMTHALLQASNYQKPESKNLPENLADKLPQYDKDSLAETWAELYDLAEEGVL